MHRLSDVDSAFYVYTEIVSKEVSNGVVSFLEEYISEVLDQSIQSNQNKSFTLFKYLHYVLHNKKRFEQVRITFPIRGHSYMECDKNVDLTNTKAMTGVPNNWMEVIDQRDVNHPH